MTAADFAGLIAAAAFTPIHYSRGFHADSPQPQLSRRIHRSRGFHGVHHGRRFRRTHHSRRFRAGFMTAADFTGFTAAADFAGLIAAAAFTPDSLQPRISRDSPQPQISRDSPQPQISRGFTGAAATATNHSLRRCCFFQLDLWREAPRRRRSRRRNHLQPFGREDDRGTAIGSCAV